MQKNRIAKNPPTTFHSRGRWERAHGSITPIRSRHLDIDKFGGYDRGERCALSTGKAMEARKRVFDLNALASGRNVDWTPWREGVAIHRLYGDGRVGASAALLRFEPNAIVPLHEHVGHEHIFVLSGAQEDAAGVYRAGTMAVNPPGSRHWVRAPEGCIVLVLWEQPIILVDGP